MLLREKMQKEDNINTTVTPGAVVRNCRGSIFIFQGLVNERVGLINLMSWQFLNKFSSIKNHLIFVHI